MPFQCIEPEEGVYLITSRCGLVKLHSEAVFCAAGAVHALGLGYAAHPCELEGAFAAVARPRRRGMLAYFQEIGLLREVHDAYGRFAAVRLAHDDSVSLRGLDEDIAYFTGLPCSVIPTPNDIRENELIAIYTPAYDERLIAAVQSGARGHANVAVLTAYLAARTLVIDGVYHPTACTPCHFCQVQQFGLERSLGSRYAPSWIHALRSVSRKAPVASLDYGVTASDHHYCQAVLRNRIREIAGPHGRPLVARNLLETCHFAVDGYEVQRDVAAVDPECAFCQRALP